MDKSELEFKVANFQLAEIDDFNSWKYFSHSNDLNLMPVQKLHTQKFQRKDGNPALENEDLFQYGCWVLFTIYENSDLNCNNKVIGYGLIDTRSNYCVIRGDIADKLKIKGGVYKEKTIVGENQKIETASEVYSSFNDLDLKIKLFNVGIMRDKALDNWIKKYRDNYIDIIGRDVLSSCKLTYDGINGTATLKIPDSTVPLES
jgi:hypothetical protein